MVAGFTIAPMNAIIVFGAKQLKYSPFSFP